MAPGAAAGKGRRARALPPRQRAAAAQAPVRLVLQTEKPRYRAGEPVEVFGYLENRGEQSYYVGTVLVSFLGGVPLHEIELRIYDEANREVEVGRGGGDWIWEPGATVERKLATAYTQLRPGTIFGHKESLALPLRPGRYRLVATYREAEALSWTEAERGRLALPVWTQPLTSNSVTIRVVP